MAEAMLTEWIQLSSDERARRLAALNAYAGEGEALIEQIADRFRDEFGHLSELEIHGPGVYHGGGWVIGVSHPLIFDRRNLPNQYLGVDVRASIRLPLPPKFEGRQYPNGYVWSPPNFERLVDRCAQQL